MSDIVKIAFSRGLSAGSFAFAIPFLTVYLHNELGVSMTAVGLMTGIATFIGSAVRVPVGMLGDRVGPKKLMIAGALMRFVAFLSIALCISFAHKINLAQNYLVLLPFLLLSSVGFSFFVIGSNSWVGYSVEPSEQPSAFGKVRVGTNIGFALGPSFAGVVSEYSYFALFLIASVLVGFTVPVVAGVRDVKPSHTSDGFAFVLPRGFFLPWFAGIFFLSGLTAQFLANLPPYLRHLDIPNRYIGYLFTLNGILVVLFQVRVSRFAERWGVFPSAVLGVLIYCAGVVSFGLWDRAELFAVSVAILTFGEMLALPSTLSITSSKAPASLKSTFLGYHEFVEGIGWAFGRSAGGFLMDRMQGLALWFALSLFGVVASVLFAFAGGFGRTSKKQGEN